jgi:hypothetical protein
MAVRLAFWDLDLVALDSESKTAWTLDERAGVWREVPSYNDALLSSRNAFSPEAAEKTLAELPPLPGCRSTVSANDSPSAKAEASQGLSSKACSAYGFQLEKQLMDDHEAAVRRLVDGHVGRAKKT